MRLYIMRHAQASFNAPSDRERPITERGVEQTKDLLRKVSKELSDVNSIWSSELLRAKQTASLVGEALGLQPVEQAFVSPDDDVRRVIEEINKLDSGTCLLVVSHQPLVGELVSFLVNGNAHQSHPYTTSEIIALDMEYVEPGMAVLSKQYLPA